MKIMFFTRLFKILKRILPLGQVLSPSGVASDVSKSCLLRHKPLESVVPNDVSSAQPNKKK